MPRVLGRVGNQPGGDEVAQLLWCSILGTVVTQLLSVTPVQSSGAHCRFVKERSTAGRICQNGLKTDNISLALSEFLKK